MPYIKQEERDNLKQLVDEMNRTPIDSEGCLNYLITQLCQRFVRLQPQFGYKVINTVIGTLECTKQEYYRRIASQYEDRKSQLNGDVY